MWCHHYRLNMLNFKYIKFSLQQKLKYYLIIPSYCLIIPSYYLIIPSYLSICSYCLINSSNISLFPVISLFSVIVSVFHIMSLIRLNILSLPYRLIRYLNVNLIYHYFHLLSCYFKLQCLYSHLVSHYFLLSHYFDRKPYFKRIFLYPFISGYIIILTSKNFKITCYFDWLSHYFNTLSH